MALMRLDSRCLIALLLPLSLACSDDGAPSETGDTQAGTSGDGDGDGPTTTGDGDGDTDGSDTEPTTAGDGDEPDPALAATYWKDTKAILDQNCNSCHVEGGIGPFALETWEQVESFIPLIESSIADLSMPPWPPASSCNSYENERRLQDDERELMLGWIANGFPEGDPADEPPGAEPPPAFESDFTVQLPTAYTPTASPDDYRCFIIPWPEEFTESTYVVGQNVYPDQLQQVHHVITFFADPEDADFYLALDDADPEPGYPCFGGPGKLDWTARWLGDWVPGKVPWKAPAGTGVEVKPGSYLIVQMHYNVNGIAMADQSTLAFQVSDTVERPGTFVPVLDIGWVFGWSNMPIPAGNPDVHIGVELPRNEVLFQYTLAPLGVGPASTVELWRSTLHMHMLGTRARMAVTRDGGEEDCAIQIDDWDFNWQGDYMHQQPIDFGPGDSLKLDCWYDNSAENQPLVDGMPMQPEDRDWGDSSFDEMCLGVVYAVREQ